jgi:hypothetical protein
MNAIFRTFTRHFSSLLALSLLVFAALGCGALKSDTDWKRELDGKKLSMAKTSGSISDKVEIWFCASGEYARRTQFSGFSTGGSGTLSMADEDVEVGRWRVESGVLILQPENGETGQYEISADSSDVISLNGTGYLVESHNECR